MSGLYFADRHVTIISSSMPPIRQLPPSMVNKIAAGEVIERPASVVKELAENSIDAGSTRIDISIENGGADLIRIADNGCGIPADQLELALSPHATSKLADEADLFKIRTFGFRGEALASVAEISQLVIKSRTADSNEGAMIQCNGGERQPLNFCGLSIGTQIEVRNLFFNTPVRRKYMRSVTTEFGHITETFIRLVLPLPEIHFTLKHNGRIIHDLPPTKEPLSRIRQLFGEEVARDLIQIDSRKVNVKNTQSANSNPQSVIVSGFVSHPNLNRPNNRLQYFFLNRRFIRDKSLQHALNEAYHGLLLTGRFPATFVNVELPPDFFDVNVHPTKMEVRFLDGNRVYAGFLLAIREKLLDTDLRSTVHGDTVAAKPMDPFDGRAAMDTDIKKTVADWINKIENGRTEVNGRTARSGWTPHPSPPQYNNLKEQDVQQNETSRSTGHVGLSCLTQDKSAPSDDRMTTTPTGHIAVQMLDRYVVMEAEDSIVFIDQHALHERILYEQMKDKTNAGRLDAQRLLVPVPVDLSPNEFSAVLENLDFFRQLGLEVETFGGNTVLISAFPAVLSKVLPQEILLSLLDPLMRTGKKQNTGELLDEMLHSVACKAAIKAGDKMQSASMLKLLELAEQEIASHHCPHGRPSTLVFTKEEIDKMFLRL